jgi:hypothetical protein
MIMEYLNINIVQEKIIEIGNQKVILDSDVAELYDVETRRINEAVTNNPEKFPEGYVFVLSKADLKDLRSKFSTTKLNMTRTLPKAFTEKGLYMLATILKSPHATQTTLAIIETFTRFRELTKTIAEISETAGDEKKQKSLMQKSSEIMADLLGDELHTTDTETTLEINFAVMKLKHTIRRK